jgi:hypothetical protein
VRSTSRDVNKPPSTRRIPGPNIQREGNTTIGIQFESEYGEEQGNGNDSDATDDIVVSDEGGSEGDAEKYASSDSDSNGDSEGQGDNASHHNASNDGHSEGGNDDDGHHGVVLDTSTKKPVVDTANPDAAQGPCSSTDQQRTATCNDTLPNILTNGTNLLKSHDEAWFTEQLTNEQELDRLLADCTTDNNTTAPSTINKPARPKALGTRITRALSRNPSADSICATSTSKPNVPAKRSHETAFAATAASLPAKRPTTPKH